MVEQMPGAVYILTSVDTVGGTSNLTIFLPEFLNKLSPSSLPQHKLRVKKNMVAIFASKYRFTRWPLQQDKILSHTYWYLEINNGKVKSKTRRHKHNFIATKNSNETQK